LGLYLDLQKAFDTVDHDILLSKLYNYGICGIVYNWFKDYLTGRSQYVSVSGAESDVCKITCGVPQGSVLGPLLFLLYINDIGYSVCSSPIRLFADDTNLFLYGKLIEDLQSDASRNIILLHNWFIANKLSLNIEKTCYSLFGATETEKSKFQLNIGDVVLHQVECFKYLGVFIDSELTWQQHIEYIYSKIVKFTSIFYKIRHKLNFQVLRMLYFAFVHPHLL